MKGHKIYNFMSFPLHLPPTKICNDWLYSFWENVYARRTMEAEHHTTMDAVP